MEDNTMIIDLDKIKKEEAVEKAENQEIITEICVFADTEWAYKGFSIHLDIPDIRNDRNFSKDPYIKVCNDPDWTQADKIVRIHLKDMWLNYSHTRTRDGKHMDNLVLSTKDKKALNAMMTLPCDRYLKDNGDHFTVFETIYQLLYDRYGDDLIPIPYPDFTKCFTDKNKRSK